VPKYSHCPAIWIWIGLRMRCNGNRDGNGNKVCTENGWKWEWWEMGGNRNNKSHFRTHILPSNTPYALASLNTLHNGDIQYKIEWNLVDFLACERNRIRHRYRPLQLIGFPAPNITILNIGYGRLGQQSQRPLSIIYRQCCRDRH